MINKSALREINSLIEVWESLSKAAREMADSHELKSYTAGYGYGTADGLENAAKHLRSLIAALEKE